MPVLSDEKRDRLTSLARECASNLDAALPFLAARSISREAAEMFGLGCAPAGDYEGRLSIPYYTPAGVVSIKYRCTKPHDCKSAGCRKYLYAAGESLFLYNAQALIRASDTVVITEGELDTVCVQAYCGIPAVAYPGVESWRAQKHFKYCFEGVMNVVVLSDGDDVGRKAARLVADSIGIAARVVDLPEGMDANSYLMERGVASLLERIAA